METPEKKVTRIDPEYQRHLQKVAAEVKDSPKWKQGGIGVENPSVLKASTDPNR